MMTWKLRQPILFSNNSSELSSREEKAKTWECFLLEYLTRIHCQEKIRPDRDSQEVMRVFRRARRKEEQRGKSFYVRSGDGTVVYVDIGHAIEERKVPNSQAGTRKR